jgi:hypothetical protein
MAEEVTVNINVVGADKGTKAVKDLGKAAKNTTKETKEMETGVMAAWGEVNILGTSLGSVGKAFKSTAKTAKLMFTSIKVGLISTGIGAFVVAIGSLVTYFTSTQRGAEQLEIALAKLGAGFQVIKDRVSNFGEGLLKIFKKGGLKEGIDQMKNSFKGVGDEIKEDVKLMGELAQASIDLRKAERAVNQETAKRRAEIEQLKLVAEDVTKTEEERLAAAERAFAIEKRLVNQRVANAKEAVRIQKEEMEASENMEADLEKLTQLEINLANIQQESTTKQIELNNKINAIRKEGEAAKEQARLKAEAEKKKLEQQTATDLETLRQANATEQENELFQAQQKYEKLIALANKYGQDTTHLTEVYGSQVKAINKKYDDAKLADEKVLQDTKNKMIMSSMSALTGALEKDSEAAKGIAVAQSLINTYQGITAALAMKPSGPWNFVQAAAIGVQGFAAVKNIMKTDASGSSSSGGDSGGGGGGGDAPPPSGIGGESLIPSQLTEQLSGTETQPVQAYVVETDISDSQALQQELDLQTTL